MSVLVFAAIWRGVLSVWYRMLFVAVALGFASFLSRTTTVRQTVYRTLVVRTSSRLPCLIVVSIFRSGRSLVGSEVVVVCFWDPYIFHSLGYIRLGPNASTALSLLPDPYPGYAYHYIKSARTGRNACTQWTDVKSSLPKQALNHPLHPSNPSQCAGDATTPCRAGCQEDHSTHHGS
jgi:hypothetical protein